ncbi:MAG: hypothetical protein COY38_05255 [Candidatus Aenigmarchaeota archaeon CG_4_10_14_0_8_um_filter_37_24]|nr:hypothetical protein [Candidatus Aenigmarchaeota archaeon]PIV69198.1 MAG: hypothetical protein COS07_01570 [Candidatus Aenigmarchaeota archaeon CG01_land_8_20_14_3_00_37_9]PIY35483.1 MAG: hypothetical protein COZ04_03145 [Candidatus Aenigmarchaeota archaeon CG_4_10_14_3_um_filter_37_21]PIZ33679.1 MAG: hypothetical protein COY38_05255 [Candidatus Aenigmarchaeota archaeon CG_4_10_14_0_8_um_filter_37_24]PJB75683.1 MAG: hypothetical protein CO092_01155 [Candidatus Aenigmarchaeota archaeon CG_4_9
MSKFIFIMALSLSFLFILGIASAQDLNIISPESSLLFYTGETKNIEVPIKNDGPQRDTVYISVWPAQWASLDKYWLTINAGETITLSLLVTIPEDTQEGTYVLTITTQSLNTDKKSTDSLFLNVQRKSDIFISEVKLNKDSFNPDETLEIQTVLTNLNNNQKYKIFLTTNIIGKDGLVRSFDESAELGPRSVKIIKNFYDISKLQEYGNYSVEVGVKDSMNKLLDQEEKNFSIREFSNIVEQRKSEYGLFYKTIIIEVSNNGNVPKSNYAVRETQPKINKYFFYPETEPDRTEAIDNRIIYSWDIQGLDPGQTQIIRYKLRFANVAAAFLIFLVLAFLTYEYATKPLIRKKYFGILSEQEELKITLHVKNRKRRILKDVVVKDSVPSIAKVVKKFDTRAPEVNVKSSGTELTWKIEKIKPSEEVVLTYKIKPLIDVIGRLTLPKCYLTYKSKFKRERRIVSKSISVTGKIR